MILSTIAHSDSWYLSDDGDTWTPSVTDVNILLHEIWARDVDDAYAVGNSSVIHFDGATWSETVLAFLTGARDVWGTADGDVFVVGNGTIARYH